MEGQDRCSAADGSVIPYPLDARRGSAPGHDTAGQAGAGAAYVFVRSGGSWSQQAKLTAAASAVPLDMLPLQQ